MWTVRYKGYWIHGYCDNRAVQVQNPDLIIMGTYKTLRGAKYAITRSIGN